MPQENPKITPSESWLSARVGTVVEGGRTHENVPIVQITMTPATVTVRKSDYPSGVILINENTRPSDISEIELPLEYTQSNIKQIHIVENIGWPCGVVVLFRD
jgi:hypothetical protein